MLSRLAYVPKTWRWTHYLWLVGISGGLLFAIVEFRNLALLSSFYDATGSVVETGVFAFVMLGSLTTMFTTLGSILIVLFSILFAVNVILLYQYISMQRRLTKKTTGSKRSAALSTSGAMLAAIGIGCASCGTAIIFSALSVVGAGGLVLLLPLHGLEFSLLGIVGLGSAIWYILGKLEHPYTC